MELREFMSVRCACNIVRQETPAPERLTFEEFAILCHLFESKRELKTSEIAEYQGVLRPTMTHRTNHLARLGLIQRREGSHDRRNVICSITEKGIQRKDELTQQVCDHITHGASLSRSGPERMSKFIDAMGSVPCMSGELIVLGLHQSPEDSLSISQIVKMLGLLQPTVSMSVATLVEKGYVEKNKNLPNASRTLQVSLTKQGEELGVELADRISKIVVRRNRYTRHAQPAKEKKSDAGLEAIEAKNQEFTQDLADGTLRAPQGIVEDDAWRAAQEAMNGTDGDPMDLV